MNKTPLPVLIFMIAMLVAFAAGTWVGKGIAPSHTDTTRVFIDVPVPVPVEIPSSPAQPVGPPSPLVIIEPDSSLLSRIDSLIADRDSLRGRLQRLLVPQYTIVPFELKSESFNVTGKAGLGFWPLDHRFSLKLTPVSSSVMQASIVKTYHPPWWVKPAAALGGAATMYFVQKEDGTAALISGGVTTTLILVEF